MTAGVYLHIPFCASKCPYCDFYSQLGTEEALDLYLAAMLRAIERFEGELSADTLYFGGGTPVLLGAKRLEKLLKAVQARFGGGQQEITIEANPCAVDKPMLQRLAEAGFNRISFGVQSLNDGTLCVLGRRHTAEHAVNMLLAAADAGFSHISADLMLAVPGQSLAEIEASIKAIAALPVDHLSAYLLKIEQGTPFAKKYSDPNEDFSADCYLKMAEICAQQGFSQYEISNFARNEGAQSRHNLKYWLCRPYVGIGPAAHSFYNGRRFYFPRNLSAFSMADNPWDITVDDGLGGDDSERLMLGLRLSHGVAFDDFSADFATAIKKKAPALCGAGLLEMTDYGVRLTLKGFLLSNSVILALL